MKLEIKSNHPRLVHVKSDWTSYTLAFSDTSVYLTAFGLEEEFDIDHFPDQAKNEAIAAYLVMQLELKSLE